jgi:hypothetical protein
MLLLVVVILFRTPEKFVSPISKRSGVSFDLLNEPRANLAGCLLNLAGLTGP